MIDAGARLGFRELEDRLRPFVMRRVPSSSDADDVLQEVFLRMQRGLAGLRDEERFAPWLYRVTRRAISDHRRWLARLPTDAGDLGSETPGIVAEDDERALECDLARCIVPFVAMLPSPYREALTLTELEGMTQKAAAAMFGVSLSGMKSRVQRGREKLRTMLDDCCAIALDGRRRVIACERRRERTDAAAGCECASQSTKER